jgi:basic membrane lipoprotein Med (substrate-binding protein (PBP1-ABC) superfamily)
VPFVNGLLALNCRLIIAAGNGIHDAITSVAKANPHQDFATDATAIDLPNVQHITDDTQIAGMVHAAAATR